MLFITQEILLLPCYSTHPPLLLQTVARQVSVSLTQYCSPQYLSAVYHSPVKQGNPAVKSNPTLILITAGIALYQRSQRTYAASPGGMELH